MSQTKAQLVSGTTTQDLTVDNINTTSVNSSQLSNRNRIINGEAQISQRGTISNHGTAELYTAVDRFATRIGSSFNFDVTTSQSTDAPPGFYKSLKLTPDSTSTPSGSQNGGFQQRIEGQNIQDFGFGTSSAKPITLSFYAKSGSSGAGTYSLDIRARKVDGNDYIQTRAFTVTSSWQRFTFTCEANGLATSESLINNNTTGFVIIWHLASGPDDQEAAKTTWVADGSMKTVSGMSNFMSATANEFYITGVQLEVGSTATDFEHRSFGDELNRCFRYYEQFNSNGLTEAMFASGYFESDTRGRHCLLYSRKRATPTITASAASTFTNLNTNNIPAGNAIEIRKPTETAAEFRLDTSTITSADGRGCILISVSSTEATIKISSEL